ncbi:Phosphotransferase system IIB components [Pseudomonas sp. NFACC23-1]|uniref:PTS transporter subunit EIIB n=1 Tax=unclassified Pseudomonas TaxID=196821 RepID=UPI000890C44E|nr:MULTISPECIES: PTS transporter subunit EIIB [unclassified Pseudomonas]SDB48576.1 Phosphotransferase system IIB components [Pseudomonas sp. NFACC17-2]SEJ67003.1 Phosphotransferase system IIB components [Pseudomonas sp. NFACC23-1]SFW83454.1 Phosphotransferase system IIB components [Pseudomonas sp. NFACC16-2]
MFDKLQQAFWKALTPDLVPEEPRPATALDELSPAIVVALGGADNLKHHQPVALTRLRVELQDVARIDRPALSAAGVTGVMTLDNGVVHLITGLPT